MSDRPVHLYEVLEEEYERLHGEPSPSAGLGKNSEERLKNIIKENHKRQLAAICLSGGGIRSATFGLGVLQGLAHNKLLNRFAYLSTVSGGGYVGGWLSAWIHRHPNGLTGVESELPSENPPFLLKPEPEPITHLRSYSNYLTPKLGLLSADTWTLVAIVTRNLILIWLVLIALIVAALALPRLFRSFVELSPPDWLRVTVFALAFICGVMTIVYVAISRPSITKKHRDQKNFLRWCLSPLLLSATLVTLYWAWLNHAENRGLEESLTSHLLDARHPSIHFVVFGVSLQLVGWLVYSAGLRRFKGWTPWKECIWLALIGASGGLLLWLLATKTFLHPSNQLLPNFHTQWSSVYASTAAPVYLMLVLLVVTLFAGVSSRWTEDEDREWWARFAGWVLIAIVCWVVVSSLVLIAPELVGPLWKKYVAPAGGLIGLITALLGRSAKLPSKAQDGAKSGLVSIIMPYALPLGAMIFAAVLIVALSFGSEYLLGWIGSIVTLLPVTSSPNNLVGIVNPLVLTSPVLVLIILAAGFGVLMSRHINTNKFSHHAMYRNRLIRAYLGASRESIERHPDPFTGFDPDDNLSMYELRTELLHSGSFSNFESLIGRLLDTSDPLSAHIVSKLLSVETNRLLELQKTQMPVDPSSKALKRRLIKDLNKALLQPKPIFPEDLLQNSTRSAQPLTLPALVLNNRNLLEAAYYKEIGSAPDPRHPQLQSRSFSDFKSLVGKLGDSSDPLSAYIVSTLLSAKSKKLLGIQAPPDHSRKLLQDRLIKELNTALLQPAPIFPEDLVQSTTRAAQPATQDAAVLNNRRLLEAVYFKEIRPAPKPPHRPLHVVNMTLNLVHGQRLAWQERKAESFTATPLHCGSFQIPDAEDRTLPVYGSYRRTHEYAGAGGITMGTAMAISGAAVSPNMGYYSSPIVTFLMTLFNVRLGWWLGNPGPPGKDYFRLACPKSAVYPIIAEALGLTDDRNSYVYLSDGGHFENLGLYEMVLRRCRLIAISDASDDAEFQFDNLGNAVQKIRTDFGIPIDFQSMEIFPRKDKKKGAYCAIGTIRYSCVDEVDKVDDTGNVIHDRKGRPLRAPAPDGTIIYVKPVFYGDEPRDIYHYAMTHETFPHESTGDQWFSEVQFESYRKLGSHIIDTLCKYKSDGPAEADLHDPQLAEFLQQAQQQAHAERPDGVLTQLAELRESVAEIFKPEE